LHQDYWPRSALVDALATEATKLKKRGIKSPFIFSDLKRSSNCLCLLMMLDPSLS